MYILLSSFLAFVTSGPEQWRACARVRSLALVPETLKCGPYDLGPEGGGVARAPESVAEL